MYDICRVRTRPELLHEDIQGLVPAGCGGLDLYRADLPASGDEEIDLIPCSDVIVTENREYEVVSVRLQFLGDHVLEEHTPPAENLPLVIERYIPLATSVSKPEARVTRRPVSRK